MRAIAEQGKAADKIVLANHPETLGGAKEALGKI